MSDFSGRVALITGAGSPSGIGFAVARILGEGGARVAIASTTDRIHERVAELGRDGITVTGPVGSNPASTVYGAAKAGILGLMRGLAIEVGRQGVTVNAVLPGWIATGSQLQQEVVAGENTPAGRSGTPAEVAAVIAFLAS